MVLWSAAIVGNREGHEDGEGKDHAMLETCNVDAGEAAPVISGRDLCREAKKNRGECNSLRHDERAFGRLRQMESLREWRRSGVPRALAFGRPRPTLKGWSLCRNGDHSGSSRLYSILAYRRGLGIPKGPTMIGNSSRIF